MMNKQTEALKMAIEALETCITYNPYEQGFNTELVETALESGKEVLKNLEKDPSISRKAQPAQEPVAIVETHYGFTDAIVTFLTENNEQLPIGTLLYTHPAPATAQEPVAWMSKMGSFTAIAETKKQLPKGSEPIALYTHPAPSCQECENLKHDLDGYMEANKSLINREWQGLNDDDVEAIKTKAIVGAKALKVDKLLHLIVNLSEQALRNKNVL